MSKKLIISFILIEFTVAFAQVIPTSEWISLYGINIKIDDKLIPVGTVVIAIDPDEIICGEFVVAEPGMFGLMSVYRDDPTTKDIDEGAEPGDSIIVFFDNYEFPSKVGWTHHGDVINISKFFTDIGQELQTLLRIFDLSQNYPNPFNHLTEMDYQLPRNCTVKLIVFNVNGREIRTLVSEHQPAGCYHIIWDGTNNDRQNIATGVYICQFIADNFRKTLKMIMIK